MRNCIMGCFVAAFVAVLIYGYLEQQKNNNVKEPITPTVAKITDTVKTKIGSIRYAKYANRLEKSPWWVIEVFNYFPFGGHMINLGDPQWHNAIWYADDWHDIGYNVFNTLKEAQNFVRNKKFKDSVNAVEAELREVRLVEAVE
jgi:hypothetical protein